MDIADILLFNMRMGSSFFNFPNRQFTQAFISLLLLGFFLSVPLTAHALGFASPVVKSHLGQPLKAYIPLQLNAPENIEQIAVELANPSEYLQLGLQWFENIATIRVALQHGGSGKPQVNLSSIKVIKSPFLSIVLKAKTNEKGIYFRHFQIRLTPPPQPAPEIVPKQEKASAQSPDKQSNLKQPPQPARKQPIRKQPSHRSVAPVVENPILLTTQTAKKQPKQKPKSLVKKQKKKVAKKHTSTPAWSRIQRYGPTRPGDNLSAIAAAMRKDKRWSNRQVMLALYEQNPNAFVRGNINRLKRGSWFTAPSSKRVRRYTALTADRKIRQILKHPPRHAKVKKTIAKLRKKQPVQKPPVKRPAIAPAKPTMKAAEKIKQQLPEIVEMKTDKLQSIDAEIAAGKKRMDDFAQSLADIDKPMLEIKEQLQNLMKEVAAIKKDVTLIKGNETGLKDAPSAEANTDNSEPSNYWLIAFIILLTTSVGVVLGRKYRRSSGSNVPPWKASGTGEQAGDSAALSTPTRDLSH